VYSVLVSPQVAEQSRGTFIISGSRVFEYTSDSISTQLRSFSIEAQDCIKSLPCLIMQEGRGDEKAYVAQIIGIEPGSDIKVNIAALPGDPAILNDDLWKMRGDLDLAQFEFNRNHWAIKDRDLFKALAAYGRSFDASVVSRFAFKPLPAPPRSALLGARDAIGIWGHTEIDDFLLEAGIDALVAGRDLGSRKDRANAILKFALANPSAVTAENSLFSAFMLKRAKPAVDNLQSPSASNTNRVMEHSAPQDERSSPNRSPNRVFVVHGQNQAVRDSVVSFLSNVGLQGIVLHEQPNMGRHLLTKFIDEAELVTFAIVLMTDDDVGGRKDGKLSPRARQNVILELGYFLSHLGQPRVCALITPGLETPSDFDGIVYIRMDASGQWKTELSRELKAANMPVKEADAQFEQPHLPVDTFDLIEKVVAFIDRGRGGNVHIRAVLNDWPTLKAYKLPQPPWTGFRFIPRPTGDPEEDQEILVAHGYSPPKKFSPSRNETVALFCGGSLDYSELGYYPIKYQTKLALIDAGVSHTTLSAGCVMVGPGGNVVFLHNRSKNIKEVHEAHGQFHTFCGSMRSRSDRNYEMDSSLRYTCNRETLEESGVVPILGNGLIAVVEWQQRMHDAVGERLHTGIDVVYLGAQTIESQMKDLKTLELAKKMPDSDRWEGFVVPRSLNRNEILHELTINYEKWFAPGVAHILLWLAVGAPGANPEFRRNANAIFSDVVDHFRQKMPASE
jgi:predicted nucleotide-binding protein